MMPIIRKVIELGHSKAITIPKSWFEYLRRQTGIDITEVSIEVNKILKISPILQRKEKETSE